MVRNSRCIRSVRIVCSTLVVGALSIALAAAAHAQTKCAPPPSSLLAWWAFDKGGAHDRSGTGRFSGRADGSVTFPTGKVSRGFTPGSNGFLLVAHRSALKLTTLSIEGWIRLDTITSAPTMAIVWKGNETGADVTTPYWVHVVGNGVQAYGPKVTILGGDQGKVKPGMLAFFLSPSNSSSAAYYAMYSKTVLKTKTWYHFAVCTDGNSAEIWIDGARDFVTTQKLAIEPHQHPDSWPIQIGGARNNSTFQFPGVIDELTLYHRRLVKAEIEAIHKAGDKGKCKPTGVGLMAARGSSTFGRKIELLFCAPGDTKLPYQVASSITAGSIKIDQRELELGFDSVLVLSVSGLVPIFEKYVGVLDQNGDGKASLTLPNLGPLVGTQIRSAFVTVSPSAPSGIKTIAPPLTIQVTTGR